MFDRYNSEGPLYVWRDKSGDKYQFHFEDLQFCDSSDVPIPREQIIYFRTEHPVLTKLFRKEEQKIITDVVDTYYYAWNIIKGRFPAGEEIISNNAEYAYKYAANVIKGEFLAGEPAIAKSAFFSYMYANYVINGRFEKGEKAIFSNPEYANLYTDLLKSQNQ